MPRYPYSQCQTARCRIAPTPFVSFEPQFFSNRSSRSRCAVAPRVSLPLAATPEGMAERRQARIPCSRAALVRRGAHLAIGALASRRSAVTVLGRASPALRFRHCRRHPREGLAAGALIEPWRRHPTSRTAVCRDATPAPSSGSSPETPLIERDVPVLRYLRYEVNTNLRIADDKLMGPSLLKARKLALPPELPAQLVLRTHQRLLARRRQVPAGAIDVEGEHGQRGAERIRLAAAAAFGGPLQRGRDALGIPQGENALVQRERIAVLGHLARPAPSAGALGGGAPGRA